MYASNMADCKVKTRGLLTVLPEGNMPRGPWLIVEKTSGSLTVLPKGNGPKGPSLKKKN